MKGDDFLTKKDKGKITKEIEIFIRDNQDLTATEISALTGVNVSKIYYYVKKNDLKLNKKKTSVEKYLETLK